MVLFKNQCNAQGLAWCEWTEYQTAQTLRAGLETISTKNFPDRHQTKTDKHFTLVYDNSWQKLLKMVAASVVRASVRSNQKVKLFSSGTCTLCHTCSRIRRRFAVIMWDRFFGLLLIVASSYSLLLLFLFTSSLLKPVLLLVNCRILLVYYMHRVMHRVTVVVLHFRAMALATCCAGEKHAGLSLSRTSCDWGFLALMFFYTCEIAVWNAGIDFPRIMVESIRVAIDVIWIFSVHLSWVLVLLF